MICLLQQVCFFAVLVALIPEACVCIKYTNQTLKDREFTEGAVESDLQQHRRQVSRTRRYVSVHTFKLDQAGRLQFTNANISLNQQARFLTNFGPYIIKLHLYLDRGFESQMQRSQYEMIRVAKEVVNYANTLLRPLNTYAMVTSLHFPWNPLATNYDVPDKDVLEFVRETYTYNNYRVLIEEVIHCVFVFVGRSLDNFQMSDSEGNVCQKQFGRPTCVGFVTLDQKRENYVNLSGFALAHELSHRLGAKHDSVEKCGCNFLQCLMDDGVGGINNGTKPVGWSTCSIDMVAESLDNMALNDGCLSARWNSPTRSDGPHSIAAEYSRDWGASCGNGILEPGEECDCGGPLACKTNRCCQGNTCKLIQGVACGIGDCCNMTSCTLLPEGTICRLTSDPKCDFPEFCDGKSPTCPPDVSVEPGYVCDKDSGRRCRLGHCLPPPKNLPVYAGQKCVDKDLVPTTAGKCKPMHKLGPEEEIEEWEDTEIELPGTTAKPKAEKFYKPLLESLSVDEEAGRLVSQPWLLLTSSAALAAALCW